MESNSFHREVIDPDGQYEAYRLDGQKVIREIVTPRVTLSGAPLVRETGVWHATDFLTAEAPQIVKDKYQKAVGSDA